MRVILLHGALGIVTEYFLPIKDMREGTRTKWPCFSGEMQRIGLWGDCLLSHLYVLFIWDKALIPSAHSQESPSPYGAE